MIGLEINMKKLKEAGKSLLTAGVFQFIICVSLGFGFFYLIGYTFTEGNYDLMYLAVCLGISSTAIVVKILYDKFELDTLAGRLTLGILVFQDIWAIVILAIQPNLAEPDLLQILWSFAKGVILVLISLLFSKYVLGRIYKAIAKNPELILATSLSWCFLICGIANYFELSLEMGALIAGIAISSFPYHIDIIAKISNIRNFFLMLFFVGLGMMIPNPMDNLGLLAIAGIASVFLIATRFISIFPILHAFKNGNRVSLLVPINLSQISEFSLVIAAIGLAMGHIGTDILSIIIFVFAFTSIISTYMIQFSHSLQNSLNKILKKIGIKDIENTPSETKSVDKDIAILGFFREASSLIREIVDHQEEIEDELKLDNKKSIKDDIVVVDFNPHVHEELNKIGIKAIYGDISNMDTLQHAGIHGAKLVISTIPDSILKGTNNLNMMKHIKKLCPKAKIIVTAESTTKALELYKEGADYVFLPRILATNQLIPVIERLLKEESNKNKGEEIKKLKSRDEIID
jgi:Kef-type K+ transport system membrane component KefB